MFCTKCGKQIPDGVELCQECGSPAHVAAKTKGATDQDDSNERISSAAISNNTDTQVPALQKGGIGKYALIAAAVIALMILFGRGVGSQPQTLEEYSSANPAYLQNAVTAFFVNGDTATQIADLFGATETFYSASKNQLQVTTVVNFVDGGDVTQIIQSLGLDGLVGQLFAGEVGPDSPLARFVQGVETDTGIEGITLSWVLADANGNAFSTLNVDKNGSL